MGRKKGKGRNAPSSNDQASGFGTASLPVGMRGGAEYQCVPKKGKGKNASGSSDSTAPLPVGMREPQHQFSFTAKNQNFSSRAIRAGQGENTLINQEATNFASVSLHGRVNSATEPDYYTQHSPTTRNKSCNPLNAANSYTASTSFNTDTVTKSALPVLVEKTLSLSIEQKIERIKRPGYGTEGKRIDLITNFFLLKVKCNDVYHYHVDIVTDRSRTSNKKMTKKSDNKPGPRKELCRKIIHELIKSNKYLESFHPVYDGKNNLFTSEELPFKHEENFDVRILMADRWIYFTVSIKPVEKSETGNNVISFKSLPDYISGKNEKVPEEIRMVLDAIFLHRDPPFHQINIGRSFFSDDKYSRFNIGFGTEVRMGYNQSIRFTEQGISLVVNQASSAFHKSGSVISYVSDILKKEINDRTYLKAREVDKLNSVLMGVRVQVCHMKFKRKYTIKDVDFKSANQLKFTFEGKDMTVNEYFKDNYRWVLKYPNLSCLHMRAQNDKVFIPMEVCEIIDGQRIQGKLDPGVTAAMIRKTAVAPDEKFSKIEKHAREISKISSTYMNAFGLQMNSTPMQVTGRILNSPALQYHDRDKMSTVKPDERGVWDTRKHQFLHPVKINSWLLLSLADSYHCSVKNLEDFSYCFQKAGERSGISLQQPSIVQCTDSVEQILKKAKDRGIELIIVVLAKKNCPVYDEIKFLADVKFQIVTQCIVQQQVLAKRDQVLSNLCLKINLKLGGINHTLFKPPPSLVEHVTILFGADAIHPTKGSPCPSIAAVVGCTDNSFSKYAASCRVQKNKDTSRESQEIIVELKEMVVEILRKYYFSTKKKPEKILFYRDGVSEGQFQQVLDIEVKQVKDACQSLNKDYNPTLTFIVVQKRHQARFKPKNPEDGIGSNRNVPAGTTVDTDIVDPHDYDYYLCSHEGIQGTSKPAHYRVLYDQNNLKPNDVQRLSYELCHLHGRCNRSISIPAPVKYADLLAYRVHKYISLSMRHKHFQCLAETIPDEIKDLAKSISKTCNPMFFL